VSFDTSATQASAVGNYPVHASGLSSTDYAIQYEPGLLAVVPRSTQTSVTPGVSSSTYGQMLRVLVSVSSTLGTPAGSVELLTDQASLGTRVLANGTAVFDVSGLLPGTHTLKARFAGSDSFTGSLSTPVAHVVNPAVSNTTLSLTPAPSTYGEMVTLIARVVTLLGTPATGVVQFRDGAMVLGTAILSPHGDAAVAVLSSSNLPAGSHQLGADYLGSPTLAPSTSLVVSTTVAPSATTVQLVTSPNPSRTGEAVTMRATVSAVAPGGGIPSGLVEFYIGTTRIGTAALVNGTGSLVISSLKSGKHQVQARYLATQNHAASASALLLHTVKGGK
jgi:large repetitive protein